ncbi:SDR family oxidoreductase (plasmid) [Deinococcus sp. KNUC1210]|uniref:SDR family NAD(P)-dependent oxidoreductase n=1 Tax=Deinococcus sp. KNUC1210 TaxID=2917691 RepID=UPI001EF0EA62|nr:SDR family oxidoreductase [Deinococcus sp. KNUC1210]ULH17155.1 SDR family oxidoreductase [Deinococcus sp. KNUC1210]
MSVSAQPTPSQPQPAHRPTALITGASGGIGESFARLLAARRIDLVLVARTASKLEALAQELSAAHGVQAVVIAQDLTHPDAAQNIETRVQQLGLNIDFLINNAGFASYGEFRTLPLRHELDMIQVNIAALTELTHRFLPGMVERRRGRVVNVASTAAFLPGPLMAVYYASKAYVLSFSEALNEEVRGSGVNVTALCPGPVATGFQDRAQMQDSKLLDAGNPMLAPMMSADEVAREGVEAMLAGQAVRVVGRMNKLQTLTPRFLPRSVLPRLIKQLQSRKP